MTEHPEARDVAVLCDRDARVVRVLRDDFDMGASVAPDVRLEDTVDPAAREKAAHFLE